MSKQCKNCGTDLPEDASFCPRCAQSQIERREVKPPRLWRKKALITAGCALVLAAVLCLSLSACGEKTSPEEEMLMTPATIDPPAKIETKPVNETIEITMDNWQDYFEEYDEDVWELDAFQELDKLTNCAYLVLKDEYASRLVEEKSSVTFEIKCFLDEYHITADVENRTWQREFVKADETRSPVTEERNCYSLSRLKGRDAYGADVYNRAVLNKNVMTGAAEGDFHCLTSYEILRVTGTLALM